ncbi:hypothetical protein ACFLWS_04000 [Chloroflexota bacterium]
MLKQNVKLDVGALVVFVLTLLIVTSVMSCGQPTSEVTQEPSPAQTPKSSPPTVPTVSIEEGTTTVGTKCTVRIVLLNATDGLSGYMIRVFLVNPEVAQITDIVLPSFASAKFSNLPANTVEIATLDLGDIVGIGTEETSLATLELEGLNLGNSGIAIEITAMEDDSNNPIEPRILPGYVEVLPGKSTSQSIDTPESVPTGETNVPPTPTLPPLEGLTLSISHEMTLLVGDTSSAELRLHNIDKGLSGYDLTFSVENKESAQIVNVVLPDFGITEIGNLPSGSVRIRAIDVNDIIQLQMKEVLLATLELEGIESGTGAIAISIHTMDDDQGNPMKPEIMLGAMEAFFHPAVIPTSTESTLDPSPLLYEVNSICAVGVTGPLSAMTSNAIPLVTGDDDTIPHPSVVAIASRLNDGRVVALGHEGFLTNEALDSFDNRRFANNIIGWLDKSAKRKVLMTTGHREWLAGDNAASFKDGLESHGYDVARYSGTVTLSVLADVGVVFIGTAWGGFLRSEIDALTSFVSSGGGLLLTGLGWSWEPYNPGFTLDDYPMNKIAEPYGIRWIDGTITDPSNNYEGQPVFHTFYPSIELAGPTTSSVGRLLTSFQDRLNDTSGDATNGFGDIIEASLTIEREQLIVSMVLRDNIPVKPSGYTAYIWHLDADGDSATGQSFNGIGIDYNLRVAYDPDSTHTANYGWYGYIDVMGDSTRLGRVQFPARIIHNRVVLELPARPLNPQKVLKWSAGTIVPGGNPHDLVSKD